MKGDINFIYWILIITVFDILVLSINQIVILKSNRHINKELIKMYNTLTVEQQIAYHFDVPYNLVKVKVEKKGETK